MGTVSFNGVLLFAHVLLFFIYAFSWFLFIVAVVVVVDGILKCMLMFSNHMRQMNLLPRMAKSCKQYLLFFPHYSLNCFFYFSEWFFSSSVAIFFHLLELRVISKHRHSHSHNVAAMIYAHKSVWHSFCLLTVVAIVPTTITTHAPMRSLFWFQVDGRVFIHAKHPLHVYLHSSFSFCATINS